MRFIQFLNEEYQDRIGITEIFVNPDSKEIKEATKAYNMCRFIINFKTKKLYIWRSDTEIHASIVRILFDQNLLPYSDIYGAFLVNTCALGFAVRKGSKIEYKGCYEGCQNYNRMFWATDGTDDRWLNKYFYNPFIESFLYKHEGKFK